MPAAWGRKLLLVCYVYKECSRYAQPTIFVYDASVHLVRIKREWLYMWAVVVKVNRMVYCGFKYSQHFLVVSNGVGVGWQ